MIARVDMVALLLAGGLCASAQEASWTPASADELMARIEGNRALYEGLSDYKLEYTVRSYASTTDPVANAQGRSVIVKSGTHYRAEQFGYLTIQNDEVRVVVDSSERIVMVSAPTDMIMNVGPAYSRTVLENAKGIGSRRTGAGTLYRIMFNERAEYEAIEVLFDAAGWMRSVVIYWQRSPLESGVFSPGTTFPKLETALNVPQRMTHARSTVNMDVGTIVRMTPGGLALADAWKGYELIDTRPQ